MVTISLKADFYSYSMIFFSQGYRSGQWSLPMALGQALLQALISLHKSFVNWDDIISYISGTKNKMAKGAK